VNDDWKPPGREELPELLAAIHECHERASVWCSCGDTWPCDTAIVLQALDDFTVRVEDERQEWAAKVTTVKGITGRLTAAEATIARVEAVVHDAEPDEIDELWVRAADIRAALDADTDPRADAWDVTNGCDHDWHGEQPRADVAGTDTHNKEDNDG
jgi:hypothetical protein